MVTSPAGDAESEPRQGPDRPRDASRGQTTLGFAVGASVFLVALLAVFLFIPGTIGPFVDGGQDRLVTSNRVASTLAGGLLGDPATPHRLDTDCTRLFFNGSAASSCHFDHTVSLPEMVGLSEDDHVNVTLRGNLSAGDGSHQLCWSSSGLIESDEGSCTGAHMSAGRSAPDNVGSSVAATRIVTVNDSQAELRVETW